MELTLEQGREVQSASQFFKRLRVESMQEGKRILRHILKDGALVTVNQVLAATGQKEIEDGNHWGWSNLSDDLLSNKYGVAALYDQRRHKTEFTLRLPPIEDLTPAIEQKVEKMKAHLKTLEQQETVKNMFSYVSFPPMGHWGTCPPPCLQDKYNDIRERGFYHD